MVFNLRTYSFTSSDEVDSTPPTSFSLKELRVATQNFSHGNFLANGEYVLIYRGRLADGSLVAVKRRKYDYWWREEEFETEVQVGSKVSTHPNVLRLRGFCRTKKEFLLVYPLMINNSLAYHLRERSDRFDRPLDWTTRKRIALGAARGLAHFHDQGDFMHFDFTTSSILLDVHFEAVIGGFSQAKIMREPYHHYDDDEYFGTRVFTLKIDVFAHGIVLLELISGQKCVHIADGGFRRFLRDWTEEQVKEGQLGRVIDPNLQGNYMEDEAEHLVRLALLCTQWNSSDRPEMSEVVRKLESLFLQRDLSTRSSCSQSECDSTPYHSFPPSPSPSPSPLGIAL